MTRTQRCCSWLAAATAVMATTAHAAVPQATDVSVKQVGGRVKVSYMLTGGPAVVNVDFQTNSAEKGWVSIGAENFRLLSGDINRRVEAGPHVFAWKSRKDGATFKIEGDDFRAVLKVRDVTQPPDWMTLDLASGAVRYYESKEALPDGFGSDTYKTTHVLLRKIPAAGMSFLMGCATYERMVNVTPPETQHRVILTKDYYMAIYETTQGQYERVMGINPSSHKAGATYPVEQVSYADKRGTLSWPKDGHDCDGDSFFAILQRRSKTIFDLPTEAQWEFAARAGTTSGVCNGKEMSANTNSDGSCPELEEVAWCSTNSGGATHPVGELTPNDWDLYDMQGNVHEDCLDFLADYTADTVVDPAGPESGSSRVHRGGSVLYNTGNLRVPKREGTSANNISGFRICAEAVAR